jgi:transglutaminase-like putative cysteine protease
MPVAPLSNGHAASGYPDVEPGSRGLAPEAPASSRCRIDLHIELNYDIVSPDVDFIFNIHAAHTPSQTIVSERLAVSQAVDCHVWTEPVSGNRSMRLTAIAGVLRLDYDLVIDMEHRLDDPYSLVEVPVRELPSEVLTYLYPSRYCQSDRLLAMATAEFGHLPRGYVRALAIRDWVNAKVRFRSASSNSNTSAIDTLIERVGVCRDFAHLMIALCRAVNIPARFATGTDYGADPALGPPDFQAYVEVYVGSRWYIFDPSGTAIPMGFVRFATGRDAADVAFATIFGSVRSCAPVIRTQALDDAANGFVLPHHDRHALSTDSGHAQQGDRPSSTPPRPGDRSERPV